jgi:hypothetical protein
MDSNIAGALIGAAATVAATDITVVYTRRTDRPQSSRVQTYYPTHVQASSPTRVQNSPELSDILSRLERHGQRATFSAVAGLLGREPLTLLKGFDRSPRTSWIVSKSTGMPPLHDASMLHPELLLNPHVITGSIELKSWLAAHVERRVDETEARGNFPRQDTARSPSCAATTNKNAAGNSPTNDQAALSGRISPQAVRTLKRLVDALKSKPPSAQSEEWNLYQCSTARSSVVPLYGPAFSPQNVQSLPRETFLSFLQFENNRHWRGLDRNADKISADMSRLREALALLVDDSRPLKGRLERLRPQGAQA